MLELDHCDVMVLLLCEWLRELQTKFQMSQKALGAIQILRDTLGGGGFTTVSPNVTGGGGSQPKCHVSFFRLFFN